MDDSGVLVYDGDEVDYDSEVCEDYNIWDGCGS